MSDEERQSLWRSLAEADKALAEARAELARVQAERDSLARLSRMGDPTFALAEHYASQRDEARAATEQEKGRRKAAQEDLVSMHRQFMAELEGHKEARAGWASADDALIEARAENERLRAALDEALDLVPSTDHWRWRKKAQAALARPTGEK